MTVSNVATHRLGARSSKVYISHKHRVIMAEVILLKVKVELTLVTVTVVIIAVVMIYLKAHGDGRTCPFLGFTFSAK